MIQSLTIQSRPNPIEVELSPVTLIVGPSNSGKSRLLFEIDAELTARKQDRDKAILSKCTVRPFHTQEIDDITRAPPDRVEAHVKRWLVESSHNTINGSPGHRGHWQRLFARMVATLDGRARLALSEPQHLSDLTQPPPNHFVALAQSAEIFTRVKRIVYEATRRHMVLDATNLGSLRVRLAKSQPPPGLDELSFSPTTRKYLENEPLLGDLSDGLQAFVGLTTRLHAYRPQVALVDEPEAFMHPGLARLIGRALAQLYHGTRERLIAATHSASFVMGCIQSGADISILRLTYDYSRGTAYHLRTEDVRLLMRKPLLRSANAMSALFSQSAVITEGDSDRAFYDEINHRLVAAERGIGDCVFLNANSKQAVWDMARPLRSMGIPTAVVVDIDFLYDRGKEWTKPLRSAGVPENHAAALEKQRDTVCQMLGPSGEAKLHGLSKLTGNDHSFALNLLDTLKRYGLFVVPCGELERWLPDLQIARTTNQWIADIFEAMGSDPADASYSRPGSADVWAFIDSVAAWVHNPDRAGMMHENQT